MKNIIYGIFAVSAILLLSGCNSRLDIQQHYPFTLSAMPVQKSIVMGETAEIRMKIVREGRFDGTIYYIRYYQPDGEGEIQLSDGTVLLPNDLYELTDESFRLYYTSKTTDQQRIDIFVEDNFGAVQQISFSFTNKASKEE